MVLTCRPRSTCPPQSNELLLAAGYALAWAETDLEAESLAPIRDTLD
jgi:hypothetical protein